MIRRILHLAFCFLMLGLPVIGRADDPKPADSKPTLTKNTDLNAIRLEVANGVIDYVNGSKKVTLNLEWQLLPRDGALLEAIRERGATQETFFIANSDLNSGEWVKKLNPAHRDLLTKAFMNIDPSQPGEAATAFESFWVKPGGAGYAAATSEIASVNASDYFCLQRDFLILNGLLQTQGIRYSVDVNGATPRGKNPIISDPKNNDISWRIEAYRFAAKGGTPYFRFAIKAIMKPISLLFPNTGETEARINVGISFVSGPGTVGLLERSFSTGNNPIPIVLSPAAVKTLTKIADTHGASDLETDLKFLGGGAELGKIITNGLLGGTSDASVISGGIVGNGKVSQIVGVNQELAKFSNGALGFLLGVEPGGDNSLFFGPSLRMSVFTFAVGLRAYEKNKAGTDEKTATTRVAGTLSIDLSRLTGAKKTTNQIKLDNSATGGDIGKASDLIARDLTLIKWDLKSDTQNARFTLTQIKDRTGADIAEEERRAVFTFTPNALGAPQLLFIPAGIYSYGGLPDGVKIKTGPLSLPLKNGDTVRISSQTVQFLNWNWVSVP